MKCEITLFPARTVRRLNPVRCCVGVNGVFTFIKRIRCMQWMSVVSKERKPRGAQTPERESPVQSAD